MFAVASSSSRIGWDEQYRRDFFPLTLPFVEPVALFLGESLVLCSLLLPLKAVALVISAGIWVRLAMRGAARGAGVSTWVAWTLVLAAPGHIWMMLDGRRMLTWTID